jgi:hypothetical protein
MMTFEVDLAKSIFFVSFSSVMFRTNSFFIVIATASVKSVVGFWKTAESLNPKEMSLCRDLRYEIDYLAVDGDEASLTSVNVYAAVRRFPDLVDLMRKYIADKNYNGMLTVAKAGQERDAIEVRLAHSLHRFVTARPLLFKNQKGFVEISDSELDVIEDLDGDYYRGRYPAAEVFLNDSDFSDVEDGGNDDTVMMRPALLPYGCITRNGEHKVVLFDTEETPAFGFIAKHHDVFTQNPDLVLKFAASDVDGKLFSRAVIYGLSELKQSAPSMQVGTETAESSAYRFQETASSEDDEKSFVVNV